MRNTSKTINYDDRSVLRSLRAMLPDRRLRLDEALRIAERQADRLLVLQRVRQAPVPIETVTSLPRIAVECDPDLPLHAASGATSWDNIRKTWSISINPEEPATRQRFTVMHEYLHIVCHYHAGLRGPLPRTLYGLEPVEYVAEYFAGCVLMPRRWVKAAFYGGIQRVTELATLFDVSPRAMEVRLTQLGLREAADASATAGPRYRMQPRRQIDRYRPRYYRPRSASRLAEELPV